MLYRGNIGIMESNMETTRLGDRRDLGFRLYGVRLGRAVNPKPQVFTSHLPLKRRRRCARRTPEKGVHIQEFLHTPLAIFPMTHISCSLLLAYCLFFAKTPTRNVQTN